MSILDQIMLRRATAEDIDAIIALLADDPIGQTRETPGDPLYAEAFAEMEADPNNEQWVIEGPDGRVMGCLHLTIIPGLSRRATKRAMIESVRVHDDLRGQGVGRWFFEQAIARSRELGATMVQLTSDKKRADAIRFYESLGFVASHEGLKLHLEA